MVQMVKRWKKHVFFKPTKIILIQLYFQVAVENDIFLKRGKGKSIVIMEKVNYDEIILMI